MKLLFLDIDGVLNSEHSRMTAHARIPGAWGTHEGWIPEAVEQLKRIIAATDCKIVISSDWRLGGNVDALTKGFEAFKLPKWIGTTPVFNVPNNEINCNRGREIETWIFDAVHHNNMNLGAYVIVDDHNWMLPTQQRNFVHTDEAVGMLIADADRAIAILNGNG
jgi:HAD domain in Swiss Army Knife RNA repair proteins